MCINIIEKIAVFLIGLYIVPIYFQKQLEVYSVASKKKKISHDSNFFLSEKLLYIEFQKMPYPKYFQN